ncbi:hypothetical protein [Anditalea andensis]|uniref:Uncharacterized protein n=1 Tax=Anditalea andensis TaxID=1048983 RepID=A0A074LKJ9_9BACT|nr:hypothetical protein [Anditalea andensis]KEO74372.1 hypothetical protein EL17_06445 [Anditalea andensis]
MKNSYLSILFFGLVAISSCEDAGQDEFTDQKKQKLSVQDREAYETKLKEFTLFMGEVFKDPEARRELFDFAKIEGNENDVLV